MTGEKLTSKQKFTPWKMGSFYNLFYDDAAQKLGKI